MNKRDKKKLLLRRQEHVRKQNERRKQATLEVTEKLEHGKKKPSAKAMTEEMEGRGFLPNGRGGWRSIHWRHEAKRQKKANLDERQNV